MESLQAVHLVSQLTLGAVVDGGAVAYAAVAISSPIGALGGALFVAVRRISALGIGFGIRECVQPDTTAKSMAVMLNIFGSYALAWAALAAAGFSLTLSHVAILTLVSVVASIAFNKILSCVTRSICMNRS